ncbi:hypothetical protein NN3_08020 [Nocardia neocaledoniensis NBRC 108232]|uniref:DUF732 domain-containing protein n=1 Tax=Nocardia neocaledoniensis TaxID=236511 RepID=A0A317NSS2_9NOCA|nr:MULTISPECIES: hypothetical protein [Nocardia]PWV78027.1 hypothetical protein DFR69_103633 [Nocardia neocaledoniensis]UGT53147.1 hypothetical protein LTT85_20905 [Nocardia asteroides]GEM29795.1 hypothetical protein NN3_08020 [Nocardia neocaledoniensis NBRC 108232]
MTTGDAPAQKRRWIYITAGVLLVVFALTGLFTFTAIRENTQANTKAQQLHDNLLAAGLPAPEPTVIANALGDDGGSVCQDPSSPLIKAKYQASLSNGASGPGQRPVIGPRDTAEAVGLTIAVYCPDRLQDYLSHLDTLKLDDTTK